MKIEKLILAFILAALGSCKAEWSDHEKERILADCRLAAEKYGFTEPEKHCDCVLRTIINRYPNPNQFENMEMGEFGEIVNQCQGQEMSTRIIWPERTQKAFVDSCISMMKGQGNSNPKAYCTCVLEEIIQRYPTNDSIAGIKPSELAEIGRACEDQF
jgi:hypothetical protein